jgi:hypothetical protein
MTAAKARASGVHIMQIDVETVNWGVSVDPALSLRTIAFGLVLGADSWRERIANDEFPDDDS